MIGLVRGLLAAPVAWLVGWLAGVGLDVDAGMVEAALTAAVGALVMAGLHWAEDRWPVVRRVVGWLGRERPKFARGGLIPPGSGPAGPSNVRRVPPE